MNRDTLERIRRRLIARLCIVYEEIEQGADKNALNCDVCASTNHLHELVCREIDRLDREEAAAKGGAS